MSRVQHTFGINQRLLSRPLKMAKSNCDNYTMILSLSDKKVLLSQKIKRKGNSARWNQ
uniref:Uncharacterized protein n=1 Tax=mine drainage metagenome TaxID=410659 RepID=E6PLU8_9ZZZZ